MREIKFRAWDKNKKEWFKEDLEHVVINLVGTITCCWNGELMEDYTKRIELMQYTGLKDKNDKEIYEGDIVEYDNGIFSSVHAIEYERGQFIANGFWNTSQDEPSNLFSEYANKRSKIIGNIYENPELLEENK